jgi:hypothetical protein
VVDFVEECGYSLAVKGEPGDAPVARPDPSDPAAAVKFTPGDLRAVDPGVVGVNLVGAGDRARWT